MYELQVENMSCAHCVKSVTEAVQRVDPQASVAVDLGTKKVSIGSACALQPFAAAIADAGYPVSSGAA